MSDSENIEMSEQDAINLLRYFEHAPMSARNKARKLAIQVLEERMNNKSEWIEVEIFGRKACKCQKCERLVTPAEAVVDRFCRSCGRRMKSYHYKED